MIANCAVHILPIAADHGTRTMQTSSRGLAWWVAGQDSRIGWHLSAACNSIRPRAAQSRPEWPRRPCWGAVLTGVQSGPEVDIEWLTFQSPEEDTTLTSSQPRRWMGCRMSGARERCNTGHNLMAQAGPMHDASVLVDVDWKTREKPFKVQRPLPWPYKVSLSV